MDQSGRRSGTLPEGTVSVTTLLVLWGLFIVYGTWLPFHFVWTHAEIAAQVNHLKESLGRRASRTDLASNVLLFLPWGILAAWRFGARGATGPRAIAGATAGGFALSLLVETGQVFLPGRTPSVLDLAANTAGAVIGAGIGWGGERRWSVTGSSALRRLIAARPLAACTLFSAFGLFLNGLAPYDVSVDLGDLKAAVARARPVPFGSPVRGAIPPPEPWSVVEETLMWSLAGGLSLLALREAGRTGTPAFVPAVGCCVGLALTIESLQIAIPSRTVDMTTVFWALVGAVAGAGTVGTWHRRNPRAWIVPALSLWASCVVVAAWTPLRFRPIGAWSLHWNQIVPFWAYYAKTNVYALADVINQVSSFVPLGMLVTAHGWRRPVRASLWLGLGFAFVLEAGQIALAERTADITDVLSAGAGAALGSRIWGWGVSIRGAFAGHEPSWPETADRSAPARRAAQNRPGRD